MHFLYRWGNRFRMINCPRSKSMSDGTLGFISDLSNCNAHAVMPPWTSEHWLEKWGWGGLFCSFPTGVVFSFNILSRKGDWKAYQPLCFGGVCWEGLIGRLLGPYQAVLRGLSWRCAQEWGLGGAQGPYVVPGMGIRANGVESRDPSPCTLSIPPSPTFWLLSQRIFSASL